MQENAKLFRRKTCLKRIAIDGDPMKQFLWSSYDDEILGSWQYWLYLNNPRLG